MKLWTQDDEDAAVPSSPKLRKIVFVNSSASLVPAPGYLAYSGKWLCVVIEWYKPQRQYTNWYCVHQAAKAAQRSLADTLRMEVMRYSGPKSTYAVQCIFAHNFITPTFLQEQKTKPELTKRIEGTSGELHELEKQFPYAAKIAPEIVANVASGDYAVCDGRFDPQLLWANAMGASPRRGWGIVDTLMAMFMLLAWPFVRRDMEKKCWGDALGAKQDEDTKS